MQQTVIDCHIHPAFDEATDSNWFGSAGSLQKQKETLQRAGVTRACGGLIRRLNEPTFDDIRQLNDQALKVRDQLPDFYIPGIQVHPHFPEESCREIERCCAGEGVRWIGELVGYMMNYREEFSSERALTIMKVAESHRVPVNLHCNNLQILSDLCRAAPDLPVVLAHPSQKSSEIHERLACIKDHKNLFLDIAGSGVMRLGLLRHAIDTIGKDKILLGSDFPISNPVHYVQTVLFEDLTEDERRAVFCENFCRITNMSL